MKKILFLTSLILVLITGVNLYAANQVVTNNNDSGAGSLRQAISDVGDGEEITFNLTTGNETITILSELSVTFTKTISIDGDNTAGSGTNVTVQVTTPGTSTYRVFKCPPDTGKTHTISNMTIKGGNKSEGGSIYFYYNGDLTLINCTISNSQSTSGGGIYAYDSGGDLTLTNCTIEDCTSSVTGGGVYIRDCNSATISGCTFDSNTSPIGGGLYIYEDPVTISNTTFSNNTVTGEGAGLFIQNTGVTLEDCTFNGNSTGTGVGNRNGGGVEFYYGTHTMTNCTVFDNYGEFGGGISYEYATVTLTNVTVVDNDCDEYGGGIYRGSSATLYIKNCLLANNTIDDSTANDYYQLSGSITNSYNIVEYSDGYTWTGTGDITGDQANLYISSSLADNDTLNDTQTLALTNTNSVAKNAGSSVANNGVDIPSTDQRGFDRSGAPDIGSYEYQSSTDNVIFFGGNF